MIRLIPLLLCCLLGATGCGVKGSLQPKGKPEPGPAQELTLRQQGDSLLLRWDLPTRNQDGTPLGDLAGFRVNLYSYEPGQYCPECRDQRTIAFIAIDNPAPAEIVDGTVYFRTTDFRFGQGVRYRIIPVSRSGRTGPAVEQIRVVRMPPPAPVSIETEQLDRGIKLFWRLHESTLDSGELLGVNIYRGEAERALSRTPLNQQPLKGNNYDDFGLTNGTTYRYGLRTVVRVADTVIESALSEIVTATPQAGL